MRQIVFIRTMSNYYVQNVTMLVKVNIKVFISDFGAKKKQPLNSRKLVPAKVEIHYLHYFFVLFREFSGLNFSSAAGKSLLLRKLQVDFVSMNNGTCLKNNIGNKVVRLILDHSNSMDQ